MSLGRNALFFVAFGCGGLLVSARVFADEVAPKPRGALMSSFTLGAGATSWRSDMVSYGGLGLGLRLYDVVTPFIDVRLGYGLVDQRLLTFLGLGVEGGYAVTRSLYPRARLGFVHQHEESMASVAEEPAGAVLGIGNGIRHRAGLLVALGLDITVFERPKASLTIGPELTTAWLTYSSGPSSYFVVAANLGLHVPLF